MAKVNRVSNFLWWDFLSSLSFIIKITKGSRFKGYMYQTKRKSGKEFDGWKSRIG